jgi:hypothetical protein
MKTVPLDAAEWTMVMFAALLPVTLIEVTKVARRQMVRPPTGEEGNGDAASFARGN